MTMNKETVRDYWRLEGPERPLIGLGRLEGPLLMNYIGDSERLQKTGETRETIVI